VNRLKNIVVGDEEVRKGRRDPDPPLQVVACEKYGGEGREGGSFSQSSGIVLEQRG